MLQADFVLSMKYVWTFETIFKHVIFLIKGFIFHSILLTHILYICVKYD